MISTYLLEIQDITYAEYTYSIINAAMLYLKQKELLNSPCSCKTICMKRDIISTHLLEKQHIISAGYDHCTIDAAMLYLKQEELLNSP